MTENDQTLLGKIDAIAIIAQRIIAHDREVTNRSPNVRAQEIIQDLAIHGWTLQPSAGAWKRRNKMRRQKTDRPLTGKRLLNHGEKIRRAFDARMQAVLSTDLVPPDQRDDLGRVTGERFGSKSAGATRKR